MAEDSIERTIKKIELRRLAARTDLWVLNQSLSLGEPRRAARVLGLHPATVAKVLCEQRKVRSQGRAA